MSLEEMMTYINSDELLEVTPVSLRLRKKFLILMIVKNLQKLEIFKLNILLNI